MSGWTVTLIERALEAWRLTGGAFEPTVLGAMVRGFVVGLGVLLVTLWFVPLSLEHPLWALVFALLGSAILGTLGVVAGIVAVQRTVTGKKSGMRSIGDSNHRPAVAMAILAARSP